MKDGSRTLYQVQESSPDVTYCPFDQAHDWRAFNRLTITKKLKLFSHCQLIVGGTHPVKQFGSMIDWSCQEPMLQQDLAQVTVLINLQWQVKTSMESVNVLCGATKAPSALMKVNAHMIRRARTMEVCEEAKAIFDAFKEFLAAERPNSSQKCLWYER